MHIVSEVSTCKQQLEQPPGENYIKLAGSRRHQLFLHQQSNNKITNSLKMGINAIKYAVSDVVSSVEGGATSAIGGGANSLLSQATAAAGSGASSVAGSMTSGGGSATSAAKSALSGSSGSVMSMMSSGASAAKSAKTSATSGSSASSGSSSSSPSSGADAVALGPSNWKKGVAVAGLVGVSFVFNLL